MDVIPVVDLKGGQVVRARKGDRANYQPIRTPLSATAHPHDVLRGLLTLFPFRSLYIADLDAIQGSGSHLETVREIAKVFPTLELWVDCGFRDASAVQALLETGNAHAVIGSESQEDASLLEAYRGEERIILSIDSLGERSLDPAGLSQRPDLWPERLIVMTLDRVGGMEGPDIESLAAVRRQCNGQKLYAAGGVRGPDDLESLRRIRVSGALVASALHGGTLGPAEIALLAAAA